MAVRVEMRRPRATSLRQMERLMNLTANGLISTPITPMTVQTDNPPRHAYFEIEELPTNPAYAACVLFFGGSPAPFGSSNTVVPWTAPPNLVYDPQNMFNGTTTITVPVDGYYRIICRLFATGGTGSLTSFTVSIKYPRWPAASIFLAQRDAVSIPSISGGMNAGLTIAVLVHVPASTSFIVSGIPSILRNGYFEVRQIGS